jgi:hypothetical protein
LCCGVRQFSFEAGFNLGRVIHVPTREKRRQRKLGKDHEIATFFFGLIEQFQHPGNCNLPSIGSL